MICRKVAVIGCGHVGLVTAAGFAHLGHRVIGLDVKQSLVEALNSGTSPFVEPGLEDLLRHGLDSGRLSFTLDHSVAVADAEFIFLTVDTPTTQSGAADLSNIRAATRSISLHLAGRSPIIVNKSTSPVGSGETIASIVR